MKYGIILKLLIAVVFMAAQFFNSEVHAQSGAEVEIDSFIENQMEKYHIPGIAVSVVKEEEIIFKKAYGWGNIEKMIPMSTNGIMNIASISKTITSTAAMQLLEKGLISLNEDINVYLPIKVRNPNFPDYPITLRQILTHTSSIKDGPNYRLGYQCGDPTTTLTDWIESYLAVDGKWYDPIENFHNKSPDSIYQYSNVAFGLLGYLVEQVSGQSFHEYVKEHIFLPLEMENSGYYLKDIDTSKIITPYLYLGPLQKQIRSQNGLPIKYFNPYCKYSFWNYPDGLVRTTVEDLSQFAIAYMNGGRFKDFQLLKPETIDKMHSAQLRESLDEDGFQGLSWFHSSGLDPAWFHGGSDPGVSTRLYVDKENKISVIVFQNANEDNAYYIARELYHMFR